MNLPVMLSKLALKAKLVGQHYKDRTREGAKAMGKEKIV